MVANFEGSIEEIKFREPGLKENYTSSCRKELQQNIFQFQNFIQNQLLFKLNKIELERNGALQKLFGRLVQMKSLGIREIKMLQCKQCLGCECLKDETLQSEKELILRIFDLFNS